MNHPKNKAERRRVAYKKKVSRFEHDREDHVSKRLAEEAAETKEALEQLGLYRSIDKPEELS